MDYSSSEGQIRKAAFMLLDIRQDSGTILPGFAIHCYLQ